MNNWISKYLIRTTCFIVALFVQSAWGMTEAAFSTTAKTPAQHLAEHKLDKQACIDGFNAIRQDALFLGVLRKQIDSSESDESKLPFQTLSESKYAKNLAIQRLVEHKTRFVLGAYFHHREMTASIDEIYCSTKTYVRMEKTERLGESTQAWALRREILDSGLKMVDYPFDCAGYGSDFSDFFKKVRAAKAIYRIHQKSLFNEWVKQAAALVRLKLDRTDTCVLSLKEQRNEITKWSNQLEALIK
jgi:hypothetical protein